MRVDGPRVHVPQVLALLAQPRQIVRDVEGAGVVELDPVEARVRVVQQAADEDVLGQVGDGRPVLQLHDEPDQVPREGVELAPRDAVVALGVLEAAGDEGAAGAGVVVVGAVGGPVDARPQELAVEALGVDEAVVVDLGDEFPRRRLGAEGPARLQHVLPECDDLDGFGDPRDLLQVLQHDQIAVGVVFVLDERFPERGGFSDEEAHVEGWVGVQSLPCGADDVPPLLGKVGGHGS